MDEKLNQSRDELIQSLDDVASMVYTPGMIAMVDSLAGMAGEEGKLDTLTDAVSAASKSLLDYMKANHIDQKYAMMISSGLFLIICDAQIGKQLVQLKPVIDMMRDGPSGKA